MHALIMFHHLDLSHYFGICPIPALQSGQIMGLLLKKLWIIYINKNKYMLSVYKEANGIKQLCPTQRDVDSYVAFVDQLKSFFEYDYSS